MRLTCASAVAVSNLWKSPVAGITAVTSNPANTGLAWALTSDRVARDAERTNHVALAEICRRRKHEQD